MLDRINSQVTEDMNQEFPSELLKMYQELRGDVEGIFFDRTDLASPDVGAPYEVARVALMICERNLHFLRAQFNQYNESICDGAPVKEFPFQWPERSIWDPELREMTQVRAQVPTFHHALGDSILAGSPLVSSGSR